MMMINRRLPHAILLCLVLMSLQGCALARLCNFALGRKLLTINPNEVTFQGVQADGLHFEVGLEFQNLSNGEASLREIRLEALLGGKTVFSMTRKGLLSIGPKSKLTVRVPVIVDPVNAVLGVAQEPRSFVFAGSVTADIGTFGEKRFSFESEPKLLSGTGPGIELQGVSFKKSSLGKLCLTLRMKHRGEGEEPFRSTGLTGAILVGGVKVGSIDYTREHEPHAVFDLDVSLPSISAAWIATRLFRGERLNLKAQLLYEGKTDTLKFKIPYTFERENVGLRREERTVPDEPAGNDN